MPKNKKNYERVFYRLTRRVDVGMHLPEELQSMSAESWSERVWPPSRESDSTLLVLDGARFFIRTLLPFPRRDADPLNLGVWIEVDYDDLHDACTLSGDERIPDGTRLKGRIAAPLNPLDRDVTQLDIEIVFDGGAVLDVAGNPRLSELLLNHPNYVKMIQCLTEMHRSRGGAG